MERVLIPALPVTTTALPITIPFNFRFYGVDYTSVWVCSNGYLSFTETTTEWTNESLPSANLGIGIAPFWEDLNPNDEEHISYYHRASTERLYYRVEPSWPL